MKPAARHKARRHALQALYQILFTKEEASGVAAQHLADMNSDRVDAEYFKQLVLGVIDELTEIDAAFTPYLSRLHEELTPIELCVLRLSTYELKNNLEVPYRVVLNEALELTKTFGTQEGFKFVNGVLDKTAADLRGVEYQAKR